MNPHDEHDSAVAYANPYWDAVRDHVHVEHGWDAGPKVGGLLDMSGWIRRTDLTSEFTWTITDPETVAFVAEHAGLRVIDPLAGSGYWAWLLDQHGADVYASDLNPPDIAANQWHKAGRAHTAIAQSDAVDAVTVLGDDRTLLLSWPPYDDPIGRLVLDAYRGARVVYIGESAGGCCGDDAMWSVLESDWAEVADHKPVQWYGMHDWVTVYERKPVGPVVQPITPLSPPKLI